MKKMAIIILCLIVCLFSTKIYASDIVSNNESFLGKYNIATIISSQKYYYYNLSNTKTYTRENLQDIVVATALQFYYKKSYSDYDYGTLNYKDFRWRDLKITPESVSRVNHYYTDCSAFAYILYNSSLGYNAADEKINDKLGYQIEEDAWNRHYYINFKSYAVSKNKDTFQTGAEVFGIGWYTNYLEKMARNYWNAEEDTIYYDENNTTPFVYYYMYPKKYKTLPENQITNIYDKDKELFNKLEPGDIVVASRIDNETGKEKGGHVFIYIGKNYAQDFFGKETKVVAFHSSNTENGANYDSTSVPIHLGEDKYSIQTASYDTFTKHFKYHNRTGEDTYAIAIIRPINSFLNNEEKKLNENSIARKELMYLKNEQYIEETYKYYDYVDNEEKNIDMYISKYNSLNNYDRIRYNLKLTNKDTQNKTIYDGLIVTATLPEGTEFITCNNKCIYDSDNKKIAWKNVSIKEEDGEKSYYFEVAINTTNTSITFDGYNIEYKANNLKLGQLTSNINTTIKAVNKSYFNKKLEEFKQLVKEKKITFTTNINDDYDKDYDEKNYSANISTLGFIESLYYNTMGIDLGFLSKIATFKDGYNCDNGLSDYIIKTALFKHDCKKQISTLPDNKLAYSTRTNLKKIDGNKYYRDNLTDDEKKIRKMLAPGMYGGRVLIGDDAKDRARYIRMPQDYEFGDIIITFNGVNSDEIRAYLYLGRDKDGIAIVASYDKDYYTDKKGNTTSKGNAILKIYTAKKEYDKYWTKDGDVGKDSTRILKEIYASNLFVVLRPTRLYGTTIKYELNDDKNTQNNLYVAYDTYKNLMVPTREGYNFLGWYSDKNFKNKIDNNSKLSSTSSHTVYAKWEIKTPTFKLENLIKDDTKKLLKIIVAKAPLKDLFDTTKNNDNLEIYSNSDKLLYSKTKTSDINISTGQYVKFKDINETITIYKISVSGDVDGDGKIAPLDYIKVKNHIMKAALIVGNEYLEAADYDNNGSITPLDYVKIKNTIMNNH